MDFAGAVVRGLVLSVCVSGLVACSQTQEPPPPAADARAGFCVGVDEAHPADGRAEVTFKRGGETLGAVSNVVTGPVSVAVTPGEVTVYVDGTAVVTMTVSSGTKAYATSGKGCPSAPW